MSKLGYYRNYPIDSNQILHCDKNQQDRHLGKNRIIAVSPQPFDRSLRNLAWGRSLALLTVPTVKNSKTGITVRDCLRLRLERPGGLPLGSATHFYTENVTALPLWNADLVQQTE